MSEERAPARCRLATRWALRHLRRARWALVYRRCCDAPGPCLACAAVLALEEAERALEVAELAAAGGDMIRAAFPRAIRHR